MHAFSYTQVTALKIGNKYPIHHPANVAEKGDIAFKGFTREADMINYR